jgi:hypothetical protein
LRVFYAKIGGAAKRKNKFMKKILLILLLFANVSKAEEVTEMIVTNDPYIGVMVDFSNYQPMVYLSNLTSRLHPSGYVQQTGRLITTLSQAKKAKKELFIDEKRKVSYLDPSLEYRVSKIIKTAVYSKNNPDEFTTYIVTDTNGNEYAIPDFELNEESKDKLSDYEYELIEQIKSLKNGRAVVYLKKPRLYANKHAPFTRKELSSVFDYFMSNLGDNELKDVKFSKRNFHFSATVNADDLVFLITSMDELHIEDIELLSY